MNTQLINLFSRVAPNYQSANMIAYLRRKFAEIHDDEFQLRLSEFLKFMYLRSLYNKGFIPLTAEIDKFWHAFILQTMEYEKFCLALPGKIFIHHNSIAFNDYQDARDEKSVMQELIMWLPNYYHHFGLISENAAKHWVVVGFLQKELQLSLAQINAMAAEKSKIIFNT